jgi:FMN-dependent oxidoreductase (nitrilotriacetate monooxygenase family)
MSTEFGTHPAARRQMHLAAFACAGPVSGSHGGWRHPKAEGDILSVGYYTRLGRMLEEACFDLVFLADILAVPDILRGSLDSQLRYGALGALRLDPMLVLASMAASTRHVGLACTISTTYFEPYAVARALATLDHLSAGRAAWNIVTSFQNAEARNFGREEHMSREQRYDRADEFVEVACALWNSWEEGALVRDREQPLFADPDRVHRVNHEGQWFKVQGPLNVSRPPQGRPVFIQAGASDRGRDFAARWAEVVFVTHSSPEAARGFRTDLRERATRFGRDPDSVKVLPGIVPIVASTRGEAEEQRLLLESLTVPEAGLSTLAYHLGVDLSLLPQNEVLPETLDVPGVQGHYREVAELTRRTGMSLAELGRQYGAGRTAAGFTGTAQDVADSMEAWYTAGACDGFMIQVPFLPGGFANFASLVVPELQRRDLFRRSYTGTTLRDHLGLAKPAGDERHRSR